MSEKKIIWGFSGIGKSSLADGKRIIDADSHYFKFHMYDFVLSEELQVKHSEVLKKPYPNNLISFSQEVDCEAVLINCHTSLLEFFDNPYLVYPARELKEDYLKRYEDRGSSYSYIEHMNDVFDLMIDALSVEEYRRVVLVNKNQFLSDVLKFNDKGELDMSGFMTRKELTEIIEESFKYDVFPDKKYLNAHPGITAEEIADALFNGNLSLDLDALKISIMNQVDMAYQENLKNERRQGFSHDEVVDIFMDAMAAGIIRPYYDQIYPYTYGYEYENTVFNKDYNRRSRMPVGTSRECSLFDIPEMITQKVESIDNYFSMPLSELKVLTEEKLKNIPEEIIPDKETEYYKDRMKHNHYRVHVPTYRDLDEAKAVDGIVQGKYYGTYSTMTPAEQNNVMQAMCALRGFGLDYVATAPNFPYRGQIINYFSKKGIDLVTREGIDKWINEHPGRCALEENRMKGLQNQNPHIDMYKLKEYLDKDMIMEFESPEECRVYFNTYDYQHFNTVDEMKQYQGEYGFGVGEKWYHINFEEALDVRKPAKGISLDHKISNASERAKQTAAAEKEIKANER